MSTIEIEVVKALEAETQKRDDKAIVQEFENASQRFKELVDQKLATPRGNNLLSSSDSHLKVTRFNVI